MCENKSKAKKLSVKMFLMPFHSELKRWYDDVIKAYSSCPPLFSCWASRAVRKKKLRVGWGWAAQSPLDKDLWVSAHQNYDCVSEQGLVGKKRGHRAGLSACWLLLRCSCDLFPHRQFVCLKARVMCLCKYALAFLPPNSNTMIIYFTLPTPTTPPPPSSPLSLSQLMTAWLIEILFRCCHVITKKKVKFTESLRWLAWD